MRTKDANRVVADEKLHESVAAAAEKSLFTASREPTKRIDLPPYDETADVPSMCYDIKSLLPAEGWAALTQQMESVLGNANALPSWVAATAHSLSTWTEVRYCWAGKRC